MVQTGRGKLISDYITKAKQIEKDYGVKTSVVIESVKSPLPFTTSGQGLMIAVIEPLANEGKTVLDIRNKFDSNGFFLITSTPPISEAIDLVKKNPQVLNWGLDGSGFLTPAFHRELYGDYYKDLNKSFEKNFGETYRKTIKERIDRLKKGRFSFVQPTLKQRLFEREIERKLLGKKEQVIITKRLEQITRSLLIQNPDILIVLDKSGRPLGRAVKILLKKLGKNPKVFFIDPAIMKEALRKPTTKKEKIQIEKIFAKEFPSLVRALPSSKVAIIDDQLYMGKSFDAVKTLIKKYSPKRVYTHYINTLNSSATQVSWRKHDVHEVEHFGQTFRAKKKQLTPEEKKRILGFRKGWNVIIKRVHKRFRK